ncbi:cysteine dioxygenase family protein [Bacillus sp. PK3_68]|uniref:cysteine dioxygenase n=1 Tax=Bacillus sp. PK3_68 TaxID=2027408 RepID=UPI000E73F299|nr:cysteine dioxygenase family protein [Bacillus sp. PK3_68]RJS62392.1 hypothetical protein CJ483_22045 [Bacillus sp. PK3_68]
MDLLERIKTQFNHKHNLSLSELQEEMESLALSLEDVSPYITEPNGLPYGRNVIFQSDVIEVLVLCFPAQSKTAIHDHGQSIGCGKVISGELTETSYKLKEEEAPEKFKEAKVAERNSFLIPEQHIHTMANNTEEKLITFHVYSPPLSGVQTFASLFAAEKINRFA